MLFVVEVRLRNWNTLMTESTVSLYPLLPPRNYSHLHIWAHTTFLITRQPSEGNGQELQPAACPQVRVDTQCAPWGLGRIDLDRALQSILYESSILAATWVQLKTECS